MYKKELEDDLLVNSSNIKSQDSQLEEHQNNHNRAFDCLDKDTNESKIKLMDNSSNLKPQDCLAEGDPKEEIGDKKVNSTLKQKQVFCQHCNMEFKSKRFLFRHITSSHGGLKFSCKECSYSTKRSDTLKL